MPSGRIPQARMCCTLISIGVLAFFICLYGFPLHQVALVSLPLQLGCYSVGLELGRWWINPQNAISHHASSAGAFS